MGMEQVVSFTGGAVPEWAAVHALLGQREFPSVLRMIDGQLSFPDEEPPADWQELRVGTPLGMVTVRRGQDRVTLVTWGNADGPQREAWNAVTWAFAVAGGGEIHAAGTTTRPETFAATAELPASIRPGGSNT